MLGETTDQAIQAKIDKEAEEHGDIVQVNYTVYVHRLQCKIICTFLKWTVPRDLKHCLCKKKFLYEQAS